MLKQVLSRVAISAVLLALIAMPAAAQINHMKADIPFDFAVNAKSLPAATYVVSQENGVLSVHDANGHAGAMALTIKEDEATVQQSKLVFRRYGDQYFLSQVWIAGSGDVLTCPRSKQEKALARRMRPAEVAVLLTPAASGE